MPAYHIDTITKRTFDDVLSRYSSAVPESLRELDALRYDAIPTAFATRESDPTSNRCLAKLLKKSEVEKLVEWKLYVVGSA